MSTGPNTAAATSPQDEETAPPGRADPQGSSQRDGGPATIGPRPGEEGVAVSTGVVVADWIKRIADEQRTRDAVRVRHEETAARHTDIVRVNGGRLLDELRVAVTRDIRAFESEFAGDHSRQMALDASDIGGGFVLRKPAPPAVSLTVAPHLEAATMGCHYRFSAPNGLPPREDNLELVFVVNEGETLQVKHHRTAQTFTTADALSEFLLVPVLTGRPR